MNILARIRLTATQIAELRPVFDELARSGSPASSLAQLTTNDYGEIELLVGVLDADRARQVQAVVAPDRAGHTTPIRFNLTTTPPGV